MVGEEATNQIYNVALNDRTSLNDLYALISRRLSDETKKTYSERPVYRDFREGDVRHSQADIGKAKRLLGYVPRYSVGEGLTEAVSWYVNNNPHMQ